MNTSVHVKTQWITPVILEVLLEAYYRRSPTDKTSLAHGTAQLKLLGGGYIVRGEKPNSFETTPRGNEWVISLLSVQPR